MQVSKRCQYALRALLELARRRGQGPITVADIAADQQIPPRFLEVILSQLRRAGFVVSRRGVEGGYLLVRRPESLSVGEVVRCIQGPLVPPPGDVEPAGTPVPYGRLALMDMWRRARDAMAEAFDATTLADLAEAEARAQRAVELNYCI